MIFALAANEPTMFLFLSDRDIAEMAQGRTKFVDGRQIGKSSFTKVIVCTSRTDEEAVALVKKYSVGARFCPAPEPQAGESRCAGCKGIMAAHLLLDGKCIVCWRQAARKVESN
jgi:hypothetical protein